MATPDYLLTEDVNAYKGSDLITLKAGTFARPINKYYVPKHIIDNKDNKWFNEDVHEYCYTSKGIFIIPKDKIRRV